MVALISVYVIWGSTYLAIKYAVVPTSGTPLPPLLMPALRFGASGLLLLAWAVRRPASDGLPDPLGWRQWRACAIVGVALLVGGNGLVTIAEFNDLDSGVTSVILAIIPLWVALIGFVRGASRLPRIAVAGIALGLVGVMVLVWPSADAHIPTGPALTVLLASLSWAAGSYYSKTAPMPRRPLVMTGMQMVCGSLAFFVISGVRGEFAAFSPGAVSAVSWWALAYLTVFGGMVAYTAYVWLVRNATLSLATTYAYVNPIVAVLLGWVFLGERLNARDLAAAAIVLASVALILSTHRPAPAAEKAREQILTRHD